MVGVPPNISSLEPNNNYLIPGICALGLVMCDLTILMFASIAAWVYLHQTARIVLLSQPILLFILCGGVAVLAASISLLSVDESIASQQSCGIACITFNWFMLLVLAIILSALFSNTHRVNRIFHNPNFNKVQVTVWDVSKPMIGIILANILVLGVCTGLHPPRWVFTATWIYELGRFSETTTDCSIKMTTL